MRNLHKRIFLGLLLLALVCGPAWGQGQETPVACTPYFSPRGGCTAAIIGEIQKAQKSVYVQAYSFTSEEIGAALILAKSRGVAVEVIVDQSQAEGKGSLLKAMQANGVPAAVDGKHAIAHNKVMIIDEATVITGSFNFTVQAEARNAENLVILRSPALARIYLKNWQEHRAHSAP